MREHGGKAEVERTTARRLRLPQLVTGVAFGIVGVLFASSAASAAGLDTYPSDPTEAEASIAEVTLGGADILGLAHSNKGSVSNPGTERKPFAGSILGGEIVDFGGGISLPLDQFIDFGQAGVLLSESTATDGRNGEGISGIAGGDGGLTLDGQNADFGTADIDLLSLFSAAGVDGITDLAIDQADFSFGLGGAWAQAIDGVIQNPDGVGGLGQYRVGDAKIVIHSPVIEQAADGVSSATASLEQSVVGLVNTTLGLGALLPGMTINTTVQSTLTQDVLNAVVLSPITTDDGLATIDIGAGTITVDVGRIGGNDDGVIPNRPVGINNQDPNTELIDSTTYPFIASSVHDVIEKVLEVATDAAVQSLQALKINVAVTAATGTTAGWTMDLTGAITNSFCTPAAFDFVTCPLIATARTAAGIAAATLGPIIADGNNPLYDAFTLVKTDLITVPVRAAVDPFLDLIANNVFSAQLNRQVTETCTPPGGGAALTSGLEVSALSLGVVGGLARFNVGNAGVRVDACGLAVPALTATSPAPAGGSSTLTSCGWAPNTAITFQLENAGGTAVGAPLTVTTDATGCIPAGTALPIPGNATAGDYTIVGTNPGGDDVTAPVVIYAPSLDAQSPAGPGTCSAITSGGWLPNTQITLQLENAGGTAVGAPVVVTSDASGNLPAGTCVPIPAGTPEGDYTVVGTDPNGAEITDTITVEIGALTPTLSVTSPAPAGGDTTVTSGGWNPTSQVSLQLTDPAGDPIGAPVLVMTDADGDVPTGTTVTIPAGSPAGTYTVVGTDLDDNTVSAPLEVYSPTLDAQSPVAPGDCTAITSGGWLPNSPVSFQLTDGGGTAIGAALPVTTDAAGDVPAGTCLTIPAATPEGDYPVVGTDGNGAEVTDTVTVDDAALTPTLTATSPVPAGGTTTVASDGWNPASLVSLQLQGPGGADVGSPVVVTTDGTGAVPAGTTVPVPAGSPAGAYTVVGTDPDGNNASAPLTVYAPVLTASSPVPAGGSTTVTSSGWQPNSAVELQFTDGAGDPVGAAVPVTTDGTGAVPAGTTIPVPITTTPGTDYSVVGTDAAGAEVSAPVEVTAAVITPTLSATSPVPAGGTTTVTSGGWIPGSQVSLQLQAPGGADVGAPVLVMTDGDGDVPTGTTVPVPTGSAGGDYTVVGTDLGGNEASDTVTVYAPVIDAASPVPAGGTSAVTSSGWLPNSAVTLQLTDGTNAPVGAPVNVIADGTGAIPAGTVVPVPADTTPGTDYAVDATDGTATVSDTVEVTVAGINPTIAATSPAPAGGETTVTSDGWNPNSTVTLQLTDGAGDPVGAPVPVTTDGTGSFPADTTVPVPADAVAGPYTVVATDEDDVEVSAPLVVYAPTLDAESPVAPGYCSDVTSGGWLPDTQVTLQLRDADGNPVGAPVTVTTDAAGAVPAGTCVEIPADAELGDYEIVGTDDNGAEITDPVTVDPTAIDPSITATSPVPAGGTTTVTSEGWVPATTVSLQLTDGAGDPVGAPVDVTTDGDGNVPAGTTVPVPLTVTPGADYTVVATDENDVEVSAPLEVTAAVLTPTLSATSPAPAGGETVVTSTGWVPASDVTLQLNDGGTPVGAPVPVTVDATGALPTGTAVPIPDDATAGDYTVDAQDEFGNEASAPLSVYAPVLSATSPVTAGGATTVTSTGWLPGSTVTLQLTDGAGDPVGSGLPVTADGTGAIPAATTLTVPAGTPAGTDYAVVGTDANGADASDTIEVVAAGAPVLTASSPVPAGGESDIESSGWEPGATVTLQLTDAGGDPVGAPVVMTADGDGNVPDGTTVPVPAGTPAGAYTIEGSDGEGAEASAPLSIYAPTISATSPVTAGGATTVTSAGWQPNSAVALQLTDGAGDPVGAPVNVIADGTGAIPAATTVPVPTGAAAGTYSVVGTDDNGAEVSAVVEVEAAGTAPTLTATSPVPAGGQSTVTSAGWDAAAPVSLQLTDPAGDPVGDPVEVTAGGDGSIPAGTTVPVPAAATAGTYTIVGTDDGDNEASAPVAVYAPRLLAVSPVPAGGSSAVTSDGWVPNSEVTLQLTDGAGDPVGDPVVEDTDGAGALPAGTAVPVPASAAPGAYSITAADDNGADIEAPLTVAAATAVCTNPTVTVSPTSAAAGSTVTVTGTGFAAGGTATVQLYDADGKAVLASSLSVPVGANCGFTVSVKIPAGTAPGVHKIVATDGAGNAASVTLSITSRGGGLATTGGEPGVYVPLAIILIALGASVLIIRRRGVVTDQL
ncbi:hypothetical protein [Microbacterium sp. NPDC057944]|uniref:hypothetical protein n=1 Tax=Microbacterium sp. NPDC057944 TaxID=3346286 RepID=UPI0036DC4B51